MLSFATIKAIALLLAKQGEEFDYLTYDHIIKLLKIITPSWLPQNENRMNTFISWMIENNDLNYLSQLFTEIIKLANQKEIFNSVIKTLNNILILDGYKLLEHNKNYVLVETANTVDFNELNNFDKIKAEHKHLIARLNSGDYNGVYTRARTMIEMVFDQLYKESTNDTFNSNKQFLDKWGWVKKHGLKLIPANYKAEALRNLAQSFGTIIQSINDLRNNGSDAHSNTAAKSLPKHHVELLINSAVTLSLFLLSSIEFQQSIKDKKNE